MALSGGVAGEVGVASDAMVARRIADVLRDIARGGLAGATAGVLIGGLGGRLLMTVAALLNPAAAGLRTENGELVGVFSVNGTLALILFGGLAGGLVASVVWVIASPWLPWTGWRRAGLAFLGAVALGGFFVVQSTNADFRILDHDALLIGLFLALVGLMGAGIAWLDAALDRRLPRPGVKAVRPLVGYGVLALLGLPAFAMAMLAYFSIGFGTAPPPAVVGWALVAVGVVTAIWWLIRVAAGHQVPPLALTAAARIALLVAVAFGATHLLTDVVRILTA